jgi:hypothetical protein
LRKQLGSRDPREVCSSSRTLSGWCSHRGAPPPPPNCYTVWGYVVRADIRATALCLTQHSRGFPYKAGMSHTAQPSGTLCPITVMIMDKCCRLWALLTALQGPSFWDRRLPSFVSLCDTDVCVLLSVCPLISFGRSRSIVIIDNTVDCQSILDTVNIRVPYKFSIFSVSKR